MMVEKKGPRAGDTASAGEYVCDASNITPFYPFCQLHCCRLVDYLPRGCPMRDERPLCAVHAYRDRGYARLAPGPDCDITGGLADLARADVCERCVGELLRSSWVRRLRAAVLEEAERAVTKPQQPTRGPLRGKVIA